MLSTLLLLFGILALLWRSYLSSGSFTNLLSKYDGIPFVGFLFHFRNGSYEKKLNALKYTHGSMCIVRMGSYHCLWLNDCKLIREAWSNSLFCGRPKLPAIVQRTHGFFGGISLSQGIIFNDGEDFMEQRRFAVRNLKNFGLGKTSMEGIINYEVQEVIKKIGERLNTPINTNHLFNIASLNALWTITTGERYRLDDEKLKNLVETLNRNMQLQKGGLLPVFAPWIAKWLPRLVGWNAYLSDAQEIFTFWKNYATKKINQSDKTTSFIPNNFVDNYVKVIKECENPESSFYKLKGELSLAATLQDLFIAGSETTATTLSWMFLYSAVFNTYQYKIHEEIDNVLAQRVPELSDRKCMPQIEAFIMETMRFGTIAPLGMIHCTTEEVTFHGVRIPRDTIVQANICAAHHDPEYWTNPDVFNPTRFLSDDGMKIINKDAFIAFSSGKRGCPGEALAKNELFLFFAGILQKYEVVLNQPSKTIDLSPKMGISATPRDHQLIFRQRSLT